MSNVIFLPAVCILLLTGCSDEKNVRALPAYEEAVYWEQIVANAPDNLEALLALSRSYLAIAQSQTINEYARVKYKKKANKALDTAIELYPYDYEAYSLRAPIGFSAKLKSERSFEDIDMAISLAPANKLASLYASKYVFLLMKKRTEEAKQVYQMFVEQLENRVFRWVKKKTAEGTLGENDFLRFVRVYKKLDPGGQGRLHAVFEDMLTQPVYKDFYENNIGAIEAPMQENEMRVWLG